MPAISSLNKSRGGTLLNSCLCHQSVSRLQVPEGDRPAACELGKGARVPDVRGTSASPLSRPCRCLILILRPRLDGARDTYGSLPRGGVLEFSEGS